MSLNRILLGCALTVLHPERRARVEQIAKDENAVKDAEGDEEIVERVPHRWMHHHEDGDEVPGEAEKRNDDRHDAVQPPLPVQEYLKEGIEEKESE
jgi:hypothetical protein